MASFRIKVDGVEQVIGKFKRIGNIDPLLKATVSKNLAELKNRGNQLAPKDTGQLRNSQYTKVSGTEGVYGFSAEYAPYVEFGHRLVSRGKEIKFIAPQPYFMPNVKQQQPIFIRDCKEIVEKLLK